MTGRIRPIIAVLVVLGFGCASDSPDTTSEGDAAPAGSASTATTTTCPPLEGYEPPLPETMRCGPYDGIHDEPVVEWMLAGEALPVSLTSRPRPTRVLAVGDSILAEAHGFLVPLGASHGFDVTVHAVGGTAPCDWTERLEPILATVAPDLVVFSFSGNAFTECMIDSPIGSPGFYAQYEAAASNLTAQATSSGAEVWWTEVIPFGAEQAELDRQPLDQLFLDVPGTTGLIPTRQLFESDGGGFSTELGCRLPWEPCDELRVRSDDGVHLGSEVSPFGPLRYAISILSFVDCWLVDGEGST